MKILIVVDMQKDFVDGALGSKEAVAIVPNVIKKIKEYKDNGDLVIYTKDTHYDNYLETMEGKKLPVPHCIKGTSGWELYEGIYQGGEIIEKTTFGSTSLPQTLNKLAKINYIDQIELIGLCTDICVISNAMILKAYYENKPIVIDSTCCAGVTPESHENALNAMKMCHMDII